MTLPAHSKVGASTMHRWAECPGSVRLSAGIENRSTSYAAEGTVAHDIGAQCLEHGNSPSEFLNRVYRVGGHEIKVTEEMIEAVEVYVQTVRSDYGSSPWRPRQFVEQRFHLKDIHGDLYGTADCVHLYEEARKLVVYDYKHGAGVAVEVKDNPQLKYYALGALLQSNAGVRQIEMVICQPRCPHPDGPVRREVIDVLELLDFSADLLDAVRATEDPNAPLKAGDHCRFCPAAAICPELKNKAQAVARLEFGPTLSYDPKVLAETLTWLPVLEAWIRNVREFAYGEAEHGRCPPGWKLVEKRPSRQWRDDGDAIIALRKRGLTDEQIFKQELRTPAQMARFFGKGKAGDAAIEDLVVKVSSGTTLVPESDKREAVRKDAKAEFSTADTDVLA